ncbi:MAG: biotin--[acetyl-CoA-carboxylase] ligase [Aeromicrobium erythreum]
MDGTRAPLDVDRLTAQVVAPGSTWTQVEALASVPSTNDHAAQRAREGAPHGLVVTTEDQTAGRGRLDRGFVTRPGANLVVSVVLRPDVPLRRWVWLPLLTGLAVRDTVVAAGVEPTLKWPNDVLVGGRKICGILLERVETPAGGAAVLGIGLNVSLREDELPVPTATSLVIEGARTTDRTELLVDLLGHLDGWLGRWSAAEDPTPELARAYRSACSTVGQQVRVELPDGTALTGRADDVDSDGRLVVDGRPLSAGDVTHVRPHRP